MESQELIERVEEIQKLIEQEYQYRQAEALALDIVESIDPEDKSEIFARVLFLLSQCLWRNGLPQNALTYAKQSLDIASKHHYRDLQARATGIMGTLYSNLSNFPKSLECYEMSLRIDEEVGNKGRIASTYGNMGIVYSNLSDFVHAQLYFQKSLLLHPEIKNEQGIAGNLLNIGNLYIHLSDYKTALEYFHKALEIALKTGNKRGEATCVGSLGNVYVKLEDYDTALSYYRKSLVIAEENDNKKSMATSLGNIGSVYVQLSCYKEALENFYKALHYCEISNNRYGESLWKGNIGAIYLRENFEGYDCKKGEKYLLESIEFFREHGVKLHEYEMRKFLADVYEREKRWEEFVVQIKRYHELKEQVYSEEVKKIILGNEYTQIIAEKEKELAIEKTRIQERELVMKELERLNTKLVEADQAKNDILGIVVHDLKNPLTVIQLKSDVLQRRNIYLTKDQLVSIGESIAVVVQHMNKMISNLLDINALESGKMTMKIVSTDIALLLQEAITSHSDNASIKNIAVFTEIPDEIPFVLADPEGVYQVVENLLSNAIKFSPPELTVKVTCEVEEQYISLSVKDYGPGITSEDKKKLFGKFQKLSARPTAGEYSTGLGLSIAKTITEQMGGTLECESVVGEGANFILRLRRSEL